MSGGHWGYENDELCFQIFKEYPVYGIGEERQRQSAKKARKVNPLNDPVVSEAVFDMFCLLHSCDWYLSGDTREETYKADVRAFKTKWQKPLKKEYARGLIEDSVNDLRRELYSALGVEEDDETGLCKESGTED